MLCIIGIGNAARGDDAVGVHIARRLREMRMPNFDVHEQSGEGAQLIEWLARCQAAFVIDAADFGAAPGQLHVFDAALTATPATLQTASSHGFGLAQALELARALGSLPATCRVYAVQAAHFDIGAPLSSAVAAAIPRVVDAICRDAAMSEAPQRIHRLDTSPSHCAMGTGD